MQGRSDFKKDQSVKALRKRDKETTKISSISTMMNITFNDALLEGRSENHGGGVRVYDDRFMGVILTNIRRLLTY